MLSALFIIVMILVLFGLTIFVHELGHFMVARWLGLKVEAFAIGFGPAIWQKEVNGVKYKIGLIPAGGYVSLPQMDPTLGAGGKEDAEKAASLGPVEPWKKILVAVAGVIMNMILAVIIALVVYWKGIPSVPDQFTTTVGFVEGGNPVHDAGLRIGDEIVSVNGTPVANWQDIMTEVVLHDAVELEVRSQAKGAMFTIATSNDDLRLGRVFEDVVPAVGGENFCMVGMVEPGSTAEKAGIRPGDLIVEFRGEKVHSQTHLINLVGASENQTLPVVVDREGERFSLMVTPTMDTERNQVRLGIRFNNFWASNTFISHPKPMDQIRSHGRIIFRVLKALVTPETARNAASNIGGPVAIMHMYWMVLSSSLMYAIWLTGLINVNLAIINLLPLPILDGGHIVFASWEGITRRRVNPRFVTVLSNIFFVLLLTVFVLLTFQDTRNIFRHVRMNSAVQKEQAEEAGQASGPEAAPEAVEEADPLPADPESDDQPSMDGDEIPATATEPLAVP